MWHQKQSNLLCVTVNSTLRKDGTLVMGAGAALTATKICEDLPFLFGVRIAEAGPEFGLVTTPYRNAYLGAFQTKDNWKHPSKLNLIANATFKLRDLALLYPEWNIDLNFPGIGLGQLAYKDVLPIIECLPDNVRVWTL